VLRAALAAGEIGPPPTTAYAVTPSLREWYADGGIEELEYAATLAAARASLRLLADDDDAPRRRVVVAADVADGAVRPVPDVARSAVLVIEPVAVSSWAAALIDDETAAHAVAAAAPVVRAADIGDEDATFAVDEAEALELQWYAVQELAHAIGEDAS
jgi:hypothetical protein